MCVCLGGEREKERKLVSLTQYHVTRISFVESLHGKGEDGRRHAPFAGSNSCIIQHTRRNAEWVADPMLLPPGEGVGKGRGLPSHTSLPPEGLTPRRFQNYFCLPSFLNLIIK